MNVTDKVMNDSEYKKKYFDGLEELKNTENALNNNLKHILNNKKKAKKTVSKKKAAKAVLVSTATRKTEIRKLIGVLNRKISEVQSADENGNVKKSRVILLQQKIASMERILIKIEQEEREKNKEKIEQTKDNKKEKVYLSKDDLTIMGKQSDSYKSPIAENCPSTGIDVTADTMNSIPPLTETPSVDVSL